MGTDIDVISKSIYPADIMISAQQEGSLLFKHVRSDFSGRGQNIYFDFVGAYTLVPKTSRHMVFPINDPPLSRRRITLNTYGGDAMVDRDDLLKAASDPTSVFVRTGGFAAGVKWDQAIIAALGGSAYSIDETGADTAVALTQSIASGAAGFTWNKLKDLPRRFLTQNVDPRKQEICLLIGPYQNGELIDLTEIKNGLYKAAMNPTIVNGILTSVMGMPVEVSNELAIDGSLDRSCYAFTQRGVGCAVPEDIVTEIGKDPDRGFNPRIHIETVTGASRLAETDVIQIICRET